MGKSAYQQHDVVNGRHVLIRTTVTGARPMYAVCVDTGNAGLIEQQWGNLYRRKKDAVTALARLPYTGQVVRVMPASSALPSCP
jgi:hypothetical protein